MAKFTYRVTVHVPDEALRPDNENVLMTWSLDADKDGNFSPDTLSQIVMSERLSADEDYGFEYSIDWEGIE